MSNEFEKFINENKEAFDNRMPNPAILNRIQTQMQAGSKKKGILISMQTIRWAAAACVILLAGFGIYKMTQKDPVTQTVAVNPPITKPVEEPAQQKSNPEPVIAATTRNETETKQSHFSAIDEQLAAKRQAIFAKLNDKVSPSQRVVATEQVSQMKVADKEVVDALVNTMNNDPNTNVRLAALEALSKFYKEGYVKKQLLSSMKKQKDPMVQIELIELLTKMRETTILKELDKMVNDKNTMEAVKDHAYSSIFTLRS